VAALENSWLFPLVEAAHLIGVAILVGTSVLVDLRLLGLGLRRLSAAGLARDLEVWTRTGLGVVLLTGPALFGSNIDRYGANPAFLFKLIVLAAALGVHFGVRRPFLERSGGDEGPSDRLARGIAVASTLLWTLVVLGGRGIADFDIY
jgi:hypothetical protein